MQTLGLVLIPLLFIFNSFGIGKLISKYKISINNPTMFCAGFFVFVSLISLISVPFFIVNEISYTFPYIVLSIQILLLLFYLYNWKLFIFSIYINWNKLLTFLLVLIISISYYLLFVIFDLSPFSNYFSKDNPFLLSNNENVFSIFKNVFLDNILKIFKITDATNINSFYKYSFGVVVLFLNTCAILSIVKIKNYFYTYRFIGTLFLSLVISFFVFNNIDSIISFVSILLIVLVLAVDLLVSNSTNKSFERKHLLLNTGIISIVFLNTNFVFFAAVIFVFFFITSYCKSISFAVDNLIRTFLYLVFTSAIFFVNVQLVVTFILLGVFIVLFSFHFVYRKNSEKYYELIWKFELFFKDKIRYFLFFIFFIFVLVYVILILQSKVVIDISLIAIITSNKDQALVKGINISFWIFYTGVLAYGVLYAFIKIKKINRNQSGLLVVSYIALFFYNPLFINLLNQIASLSNLFIFDFKIYFLILILIVYLSFYKNVVKMDYNNSRYFGKLDHKYLNFKKKMGLYLTSNYSIMTSYSLMSLIIFAISIASISI
ncbi:hypothetical protein [Malacoplasma iowae]|uniref:hypothetical protein n=1 Tax=Malacoplasma iowae TaxID=2116 RepID=UPI002A186CD0|nr:hypothetical protein [Malacoplasma iowae]WPL39959.1 hypothetical protein QX183_00220 [Malacoplasma iowae]